MSSNTSGLPNGSHEQGSLSLYPGLFSQSDFNRQTADDYAAMVGELSPGSHLPEFSPSFFRRDSPLDAEMTTEGHNDEMTLQASSLTSIPQQTPHHDSADLLNITTNIQADAGQGMGGGTLEGFLDQSLNVSGPEQHANMDFIANFPDPKWNEDIFDGVSNLGHSVSRGEQSMNTNFLRTDNLLHPQRAAQNTRVSPANQTYNYSDPSTEATRIDQSPYFGISGQQQLSQAQIQQILFSLNAPALPTNYGSAGQPYASAQPQASTFPTQAQTQQLQAEIQQLRTLCLQQQMMLSQASHINQRSTFGLNIDPNLLSSLPQTLPSTPAAVAATPLTVPTTPALLEEEYTKHLRARKCRGEKLEDSSSESDAESDESEYTASGRLRSKYKHKTNRYNRDSETDKSSKRKLIYQFQPEPPKLDPDKPWCRINRTTKGLSARTGKINNFDGQYEDVENTFQPWQSSSGFVFQYDHWGGLSQPTRSRQVQSKVSYTTNQIREFIYEHPEDTSRNQKLILWIQQVPSDSTRRYPTEHAHTCRFDDCPEKSFKRNIRTGYYQVAFDEKWTTHNTATNPFHMAGFVHLYCLERFLDFPDICARFDVRIDGRQSYPGEPKDEFAGSLLRSGTRGDEFGIASEFVELCKNNTLALKYPNYPVHASTPAGARKDHSATLTCALTREKNEFVTPSKAAKNEKRGLKASFLEVNFGDLQTRIDFMIAEKQRKRDEARRLAVLAETQNASQESGQGDIEAGFAAPVAQMTAAPAVGSATQLLRSGSTSKRKAVVISSDEESEGDVSESEDEWTNKRQTKKTRRIKGTRCAKKND